MVPGEKVPSAQKMRALKVPAPSLAGSLNEAMVLVKGAAEDANGLPIGTDVALRFTTVDNVPPTASLEVPDVNASNVPLTTVVTDLAEDSTAANVGFQKGDIIVAVNNQKIAKTADLDRATHESARLWRIVVVRGGQQINVTLGG